MAVSSVDVREGPWPGEEVARGVLRRLGLEPSVLSPLQWKPGQLTPLYYLETAGRRFVLKLPTPRAGVWLEPLRRHLTRQEIAHQAHVLQRLGVRHFQFLRVPRLVATDHHSFTLLEFIDIRPHGEHDIPRRELLHSLLEFQASEIDLPQSILAAVGRDPGVLVVRSLLTSLQPHLGWRGVSRALKVVADCYQAQPPLPRPVLRHNDFHYNNLLLGGDGTLYFSDFEYVAFDNRWLLGDIVYFAVGTKSFGIAGDLILEYAALLRDSLGYDFDLEAQLRFNLLLRVGKQMISRTSPPEVVTRYRQLFREVLIDDRGFREWMSELESQSLAALPSVSSS
jgi:hypothetical protein